MISLSLVYDDVFPIFFFCVRRSLDSFRFQTLMMTKKKMKIHHDLTDGCTPLQPLLADGKCSRSWFFFIQILIIDHTFLPSHIVPRGPCLLSSCGFLCSSQLQNCRYLFQTYRPGPRGLLLFRSHFRLVSIHSCATN